MKPRRAPYVVPIKSAARVWPVTGTGEPGTGMAIWARAAINPTPPTTKSACVSAVLRGKTVARSELE